MPNFIYECTLAVVGLMNIFTFLRRTRWVLIEHEMMHYLKTVYVKDCLLNVSRICIFVLKDDIFSTMKESIRSDGKQFYLQNKQLPVIIHD